MPWIYVRYVLKDTACSSLTILEEKLQLCNECLSVTSVNWFTYKSARDFQQCIYIYSCFYCIFWTSRRHVLEKSEFWAQLKGGKSLDELTREVTPSQTRPGDPDKNGICGGH